MMNKKILLSVFAAQMVFAPSVFALSCNNPINAYDKTYCAASKMVQLDKEINQQYGATLKTLNAAQKKTLKQNQIKWIRARDSECSNNGLVNVACVNKKMDIRIALLKSIERECQGSGCDESSLSKVE